jgi:hypothetical protein
MEESNYRDDYVESLGLLRFGIARGGDRRLEEILEQELRAFDKAESP